MNKYYFIYLIWLLPIYFLFQSGYQTAVYFGLQNTYENGDSYVANVTDFDVKQIAAQTNGYVVLEFTLQDGSTIEEQLALSVQMAQVIMESEVIPIRYNQNSFNPIVIMSTFSLQQNVVKVNLAVLTFGLIVTFIVSIYASKYARRKVREGDDIFEIERVDSDSDE